MNDCVNKWQCLCHMRHHTSWRTPISAVSRLIDPRLVSFTFLFPHLQPFFIDRFRLSGRFLVIKIWPIVVLFPELQRFLILSSAKCPLLVSPYKWSLLVSMHTKFSLLVLMHKWSLLVFMYKGSFFYDMKDLILNSVHIFDVVHNFGYCG